MRKMELLGNEITINNWYIWFLKFLFIRFIVLTWSFIHTKLNYSMRICMIYLFFYLFLYRVQFGIVNSQKANCSFIHVTWHFWEIGEKLYEFFQIATHNKTGFLATKFYPIRRFLKFHLNCHVFFRKLHFSFVF